MNDPLRNSLNAAAAIRDSSALLITAGAGMGVDSGLPDFRGPEGFWQAYPPYRRLGLRFEQIANPTHFKDDPHLAWGFYGHRLNLYRNTKPHCGFGILRNWTAAKSAGSFVFTSNVDGQFTAAGFPAESIVECHGSIHHLQCIDGCDGSIWPADNIKVKVDPTTMRALDPLPRCPKCNAIARPNILMFSDGHWLSDRTDAADAAYTRWYNHLAPKALCVIECGAGSAIPTVRLESERIAKRCNAKTRPHQRARFRRPGRPDFDFPAGGRGTATNPGCDVGLSLSQEPPDVHPGLRWYMRRRSFRKFRLDNATFPLHYWPA